MAYLTRDEILSIGFKYVGDSIKISDKAVIYNPELIEINDNSRIDDFCVLSGNIRIGRNVHITVFCNIAGGAPGINIEDFATIAYGCHVFSQSDDYSGSSMTNSTIPRRFKKEKFDKVNIGRYVIIGASSVILPGCNIGEGCSIGAMSLLTKSTSPWGVYYGVPAKRIKDRKKELLQMTKIFLNGEKENYL